MKIADEYGRDEAIAQAYAGSGYSLKEIGDYFGLHYSRISRIVNKQRPKQGLTVRFIPKYFNHDA